MDWIIFIITAAFSIITTILRRPTTLPKDWKKRLLWMLIITTILVLAGTVFGLRFVVSFAVGYIAGPVGFFLFLFFIGCLVLFLVFRGNPRREDEILKAR